MKNIFASLLFFLLFSKGYSQIPNSDFENWTNNIMWVECDDWFSVYGDFVAPLIAPDSDEYTGNLAMAFYTLGGNAWANTGFTTTTRPVNFHFYVKEGMVPAQSIETRVVLFNNGAAVDSGVYTAPNTFTVYTPVSVPISNSGSNIDSVFIELSVNGSTSVTENMLFDHLSFDNVTGTGDDPTENETTVSLLQNPNQNNFIVQFHSTKNEAIKLEVINALGEVLQMKNETISSGISNMLLQTEMFPSGVYFIRVSNEKQEWVLEAVKQE